MEGSVSTEISSVTILQLYVSLENCAVHKLSLDFLATFGVLLRLLLMTALAVPELGSSTVEASLCSPWHWGT